MNSNAGRAPGKRLEAAWQRRLYLYLGVLSVGVGIAVRSLGLWDDFWLDEVMSFFLAREMPSLWAVLFELQIEHHILNTVFIHAVGDDVRWVWYRLPPLVSGVALIVVTGLAARGRGWVASASAMWLIAISFPLIAFSTEARGYAPAACFSMAAYVCVCEYERGARHWAVTGYWFFAVAALLGQLSAIFVLLGIGIHSLGRWLYGDPRWTWRRLMLFHGVPAVGAAAIYWVFVRRFQTVGGTKLPLDEVVLKTLSVIAGGPFTGGLAVVAAAALVIGLVGAALWGVRRPRTDVGHYRAFGNRGSDRRDPHAILFLAILLVVPVAMIVATSREYVYVRYFAVCMPFAYLLLATGVSRLSSCGRAGIAMAVLAVGLMSLGHIRWIASDVAPGRGSYFAAVRYMTEEGRGEVRTVGSDHDFRNEMMVRFFARYAPNGHRLRYHHNGRWPASGVDWLIVSDTERASTPQATVTVGGVVYQHVREFVSKGLSPLHWNLYRKT